MSLRRFYTNEFYLVNSLTFIKINYKSVKITNVHINVLRLKLWTSLRMKFLINTRDCAGLQMKKKKKKTLWVSLSTIGSTSHFYLYLNKIADDFFMNQLLSSLKICVITTLFVWKQYLADIISYKCCAGLAI